MAWTPTWKDGTPLWIDNGSGMVPAWAEDPCVCCNPTCEDECTGAVATLRVQVVITGPGFCSAGSYDETWDWVGGTDCGNQWARPGSGGAEVINTVYNPATGETTVEADIAALPFDCSDVFGAGLCNDPSGATLSCGAIPGCTDLTVILG